MNAEKRISSSQIDWVGTSKATPIEWVGIALLALGLCAYSIPDEATSYRSQVIADMLCLASLGAFSLTKLPIISNSVMVFSFGGIIGIAGTLASINSSQTLQEMLTTWRYLVFIPCLYLFLGYNISRLHPERQWLAILPSCLINIALISVAVTRPFIGEMAGGTYVSEAGRYFRFPIGALIIRPVTVAEACSASFALGFLALAQLRTNKGKALIILTATAVTLSLIAATRTYIFAFGFALLSMLIAPILRGRIAVRTLVGGMALVCLSSTLLLFKSAREYALTYLDRFFQRAELFGDGGRISIWQDRLNTLHESSMFSGMSMDDYRSWFQLSSHNLFLDLGILGGKLYLSAFIIFTCSLLYLTIPVIVKGVDRFRDGWLAPVIIMYLVALMVSSPLISTKQTMAAFYLFSGLAMGRLALRKARTP